MNIVPVNPYQKLTKRQMFQLFWYAKMVLNFKNINFDYITDFHMTETLIQQFNNHISVSHIKADAVYQNLLKCGLYDADSSDIRNVIDTLDIFYRNYTEIHIQQFATAYVDWINYFYYQYDIDYRFQAKPVIWDMHRNYNVYTIMQLEHGALMETFVGKEFQKYGIDIGFYYDPTNQSRGENRACIEIKHDMASERTGNYYIEYSETLFEAELVPSGIFKQDNIIFWLIGTPNEYQIIYKRDLQKLFFSMNQNDTNWQDGKRFVTTRTSKGFLIQKEKLKEIAVAHSIAEFVQKFYIRQVVA